MLGTARSIVIALIAVTKKARGIAVPRAFAFSAKLACYTAGPVLASSHDALTSRRESVAS